MKKIFSVILAAVVAMSVFNSCSKSQKNDRAHVLKVYSWEDYIDPEVLNGFHDWYKAQTGEEIYVIYDRFDKNESMLTEIQVGHEDYDVICPSEYIIERMLKDSLLLKIEKDLIPVDSQYFNMVSPFVVDKFQQMAPDSLTNVSDYTVGYMWGTTGFIYNTDIIKDPVKLRSWGALTDPEFKGRILMKDAVRDVYSIAVLYAYRDSIEAGVVTREELVRDMTPERIAAVEKVLTDAKDNIAGWEVDFGKEEMTKGKTWINLSWSGDAMYAIDQADSVGVHLDYIVPDEGSNVWFDGWCIPKYAKNTKAATYWINYMCKPENAIKNMDYTGYVSVIRSKEVLEWANNPEENEEALDLSYFFYPEDTAVYANPIMYPDRSTIERCALMHDAGDMNEELMKMWNRVKGDNLSLTMIIVIVITVLLIVIVVVRTIMKKRKQQAMQNKRHRR